MRALSASGRRTPRNARHLRVVRISPATLARRRRLLHVTLAIGAVFFVASIVVRARVKWVIPPQPDPPVPHAQLNPIEARIVELVNAARTRVGADPLAVSDRLTLAARAHAQDMAAHSYLALDSAAGDTPVDRARAAGLDYDELAENVLSDPGDDLAALPQRVLTSWLGSPSPRNNLLSPRFRTTAIAVAQAADGSYYVALDLMR
jgi:uncharacterized protein YkwD